MNLSDSINGLLGKGSLFTAAVETILTYTSEDDVMSECIKRGEYRNDLQKAIDALADREGEISTLKRKLRQARAEQKTDLDKLEAKKWELIRERKLHGIS